MKQDTSHDKNKNFDNEMISQLQNPFIPSPCSVHSTPMQWLKPVNVDLLRLDRGWSDGQAGLMTSLLSFVIALGLNWVPSLIWMQMSSLEEYNREAEPFGQTLLQRKIGQWVRHTWSEEFNNIEKLPRRQGAMFSITAGWLWIFASILEL